MRKFFVGRLMKSRPDKASPWLPHKMYYQIKVQKKGEFVKIAKYICINFKTLSLLKASHFVMIKDENKGNVKF